MLKKQSIQSRKEINHLKKMKIIPKRNTSIPRSKERVIGDNHDLDDNIISSESDGHSVRDIHQLQQSKSANNIGNLQAQLKACKSDSGFFDPMAAFNCLNQIQKAEDPKAYEPELQQALENKIKNDKIYEKMQFKER